MTDPERLDDRGERKSESHASPGGAAAAGAVTGGAIGAAGAGPVGAAVGAVTGALAGLATERGMHADDEGVANVPDARGGPIVEPTSHQHRWVDDRCDCGTSRT